MDSTTYRGIAFLLSLGALPIACEPNEDGGTDDGTGGTSDATDGAGTTSGAPTTSSDGTTGESGTTGGMGDPAGSCALYVEYVKRCNPDGEETEAELYSYCSMTRKRVEAVYGPDCLVAHDAVNECLATIACDDPDPCPDEIDASNLCTPAAGAGCMAFAAKEAECYDTPEPEYAAGACQVYVNDRAYYFGAACGAAFEELYVCLVDLPCPDFLMREGCDAEQAKLDTACGGP